MYDRALSVIKLYQPVFDQIICSVNVSLHYLDTFVRVDISAYNFTIVSVELALVFSSIRWVVYVQ